MAPECDTLRPGGRTAADVALDEIKSGGTAATTRRTSGPAAGRVVGSGFEQCDLEVVAQDDGACQELLLLGGEEPDVSSEQAHGDGYDVVQGDHSVVFESVPRPDRGL